MSEVRLLLIGDIFVSRPNPASAFATVAPQLEWSDIAFCNVESVVANAKYCPVESGTPRMDESVFGAYVRAGINVVSQANNPMTFRGVDALVRSVDVVDAAGVLHGGAGHNLAEARNPAVVEHDGTKVAFVFRTSVGNPELAATARDPGVAYFPVHTSFDDTPSRSRPGRPPIVHTHADRGEPLAALEEDIRRARELADIVIVSWHWGHGPDDGAIREAQEELGHAAIDFGADVLMGHGSHHSAPVEVYKGKPIVHCPGSFVNDLPSHAKEKPFAAYVIRCTIRNGQITRFALVPGTVVGNGPPVFGHPSDAEETVKAMIDGSSPFATQFRIGDDDIEVLLGHS